MPRPLCLFLTFQLAASAIWSGGLIEAAESTPQAARNPVTLPGQQADGSILLPNQWSLRPVGRQVRLGDFPVNIAVHPGSGYAAVLHCGYGPHEVVVVDIHRAKVVCRVGIEEGFYGLAFAPDGSRLFISGAGDEVVHSFSFREGYLSDPRQIRLREASQRGVPAGLAVSRDGRRLWVANVRGHQVDELNLESGKVVFELSTLAGTKLADGNGIKPPSDPDLAAATKRDEARLQLPASAEPFPYGCVVDEARRRLYVSLWAQAQVAVVDLDQHLVVDHWPTQEHPNEMVASPSGKILYVANANRNTVTVLDLDTGKTLETLTASLYPQSPPGSTPNSLALTPDGQQFSFCLVPGLCLVVPAVERDR
ncbi:MAG: YncE family protein, partial [Candidatus Omnitrophica bacterium]|nr:YncE family protein [Candidatus Omnitrophota bacterium]